jgi:23S rRNA pseudouridine2604 synthase
MGSRVENEAAEPRLERRRGRSGAIECLIPAPRVLTLHALVPGITQMSDPIRLAKRVADLARCSRAEAVQYIEGGWVSVAGKVVEEPQRMVTSEAIAIDPGARLAATEPATVLLHKPPGFTAIDGRNPAAALVTPATRWDGDASGMRLSGRHFVRLTPLVPLDDEASGLMVLTQDGRIWRRLTEDADLIEHEFIVEVSGQIEPYGLRRLNHGLRYRGGELLPCKVSWQNEVRLRFAIRAAQPGQLRDMCAQVGLEVVAIRRIRIGRIPLAKMPVGQWRYLPVGEKF